MPYEDLKEKYPIESDEWYKKAHGQSLESLPLFIEEVRKAFPSYNEFPNYNQKDWLGSDEQNLGYRNGMVAGVLISIAAYEAVARRYGWSCNQAGCVRNCIYKSFGLSDGKEDDLNRL